MLLRRFAPLLELSMDAAGASGGSVPSEAALAEMATGGKLRFGIAFAPEGSTLFVNREANGQGRGVAVDLAHNLAGALVGRHTQLDTSRSGDTQPGT